MTSRHSQRRDLLTAGPGLELIEIGLGDLLELTGEAFGVNDLRPERDSAPHGRLVGGEARARGSGELRQTGEAADEPGDVGQAELAVGGEEVLEGLRSEEHTSELQSLMRISYVVFCLKKKK